jgi:hypothetical protein
MLSFDPNLSLIMLISVMLIEKTCSCALELFNTFGVRTPIAPLQVVLLDSRMDCRRLILTAIAETYFDSQPARHQSTNYVHKKGHNRHCLPNDMSIFAVA